MDRPKGRVHASRTLETSKVHTAMRRRVSERNPARTRASRLFLESVSSDHPGRQAKLQVDQLFEAALQQKYDEDMNNDTDVKYATVLLRSSFLPTERQRPRFRSSLHLTCSTDHSSRSKLLLPAALDVALSARDVALLLLEVDREEGGADDVRVGEDDGTDDREEGEEEGGDAEGGVLKWRDEGEKRARQR